MLGPKAILCTKCQSFPHARGDGPIEGKGADASKTFSPRAWGWSVMHDTYIGKTAVFPTRVGMVRA